MGIGDYIASARRHWLALTTFTLLGVLVAGGLSVLAVPTYSTKAEVYVVTDAGDSASDLANSSDYSQKQVRSYSALATRPVVLDPVVKDLGLNVSADTLAKSVSASSVLNTNLVSLTATSTSASEAAAVANGVAKSLATVVLEIVPKAKNGDPTVSLKIVRSATVPAAPTSPNVKIWLLLGVVIGFAAGASIVALRELLDTKVRSPKEAQAIAGAPIIGSIPMDPDGQKHPTLGASHAVGPRAEAFRHIRTNLQFLDATARQRLVVVTSSIPGEGKSTTAINVALTLADGGNSVCIVDADLRRPAIARYLGLEGSAGLSTLLSGRAELDDVLQCWGDLQLYVLASGLRPPNPTELLASKMCIDVFDALTERFDYVIVDSPPLVPVTDAAVLAHLAGGAILVVGAGVVDTRDLEHSVDALASAQAPARGIIVNRVKADTLSRYAYGYEEPSRRQRGRRRRAAETTGAMGDPSPLVEDSVDASEATAPGDAASPELDAENRTEQPATNDTGVESADQTSGLVTTPGHHGRRQN